MDEERSSQVKQFQQRKNSLTEHDIEDIIRALESKSLVHTCRFGGVTQDEFYESVKFFKYLNSGFTSGRNIIAKTILVLLVTFLFGMIGMGVVTKIKG